MEGWRVDWEEGGLLSPFQLVSLWESLPGGGGQVSLFFFSALSFASQAKSQLENLFALIRQRNNKTMTKEQSDSIEESPS